MEDQKNHWAIKQEKMQIFLFSREYYFDFVNLKWHKKFGRFDTSWSLLVPKTSPYVKNVTRTSILVEGWSSSHPNNWCDRSRLVSDDEAVVEKFGKTWPNICIQSLPQLLAFILLLNYIQTIPSFGLCGNKQTQSCAHLFTLFGKASNDSWSGNLKLKERQILNLGVTWDEIGGCTS